MKHIFIVLIIASAVSCAPVQKTSTIRTSNTASQPVNLEREMLNLINSYRTKGYRGYPAVPPLRWNTRLEASAKAHSNYMSGNNILSHTGRNGSDPGARIKAAGYNWSAYGENIAMGQQTVREVVTTWVNSPAHLKNIMNRHVTEMGAAKSGRYWTQVFGRP